MHVVTPTILIQPECGKIIGTWTFVVEHSVRKFKARSQSLEVLAFDVDETATVITIGHHLIKYFNVPRRISSG